MKMDVTSDDKGNTLVSINGKDVTDRLEDVTTSENVATYGKMPEVRVKVKEIQKQMGESSLVCEGRDITSVVFPHARFKFYLTASLKVRAKRRFSQEVQHKQDVTLAQVQKGIANRDHQDMTREISPLVRVKDAILIDSSKMTAQQTADKIAKIINKKIKKKLNNPSCKNATSSGKECGSIGTGDFKKPFGSTAFRRYVKVNACLPYKCLYLTSVINKQELKKHRGKPVIFAINHRTNADVFATFLTFPQYKLHYIGKESLFKPKTFTNWFLRSLNGVPVRPNNNLAIIRHSLNVLKNGESMIIFPEGRRNFNAEDALSVRNGTAVIAMKAGVPVIPIVTNRAPRPFKANKFKIGTTIYPDQFTDKNDFSNALRDEMSRLLDGFEHKPKQKKWDKEPVIITRGITFIDGKLLVIKRVRQGQTYYVFPGGHVDPGETTRQAVVREVKEETNVVAEATRLLYKNKSLGKMQSFYLCQYKSGVVSKTDAEEYQNGADLEIDCRGTPRGTFEPLLVNIDDIANIDLRPNVVRDQLCRDIKRYTIHLTRPTKYLKT